mmetsp:Transcript_26908/g.64049  ORF Transcript_26908/g.64049 Transcript_26908/m.64049 type:complete len:204 (-) Transcript_26908:245-856(-)
MSRTLFSPACCPTCATRSMKLMLSTPPGRPKLNRRIRSLESLLSLVLSQGERGAITRRSAVATRLSRSAYELRRPRPRAALMAAISEASEEAEPPLSRSGSARLDPILKPGTRTMLGSFERCALIENLELLLVGRTRTDGLPPRAAASLLSPIDSLRTETAVLSLVSLYCGRQARRFCSANISERPLESSLLLERKKKRPGCW